MSVESKSHGLEVTCRFSLVFSARGCPSLAGGRPVLIAFFEGNRAGFDGAFVGLSLVVVTRTFV